ncbi:MAG TPA: CbiX/SirB N-terminal domain-containing protein [Casimicrobiaceae bacterium]
MSNASGLILYVHGARDPRWAEPFRRLRELVAGQATDCIVMLAFLDYLQPDLATVARQLSAQGIARARVVPMFFGRGGHLRDDLPKQLQLARQAAPALAFTVTEPAGESETVLGALAAFAIHAPGQPIDSLGVHSHEDDAIP